MDFIYIPATPIETVTILVPLTIPDATGRRVLNPEVFDINTDE
jgi:hypothetical protein